MFRYKALWQLGSMSARDMFRNRLTGLAPLFLFGWLLVLYFVLSLMLSVSVTDPGSSLLRASLPSILMTGIAGIAFMATAVPIVSMRERGMLRLLGTTPLKKFTFLLAQLPIRIGLVVAEVGFVLALANVAGFADRGVNYWRLAVTLILGGVMLFACAWLVASRARNAEAAHQFATMLVMGTFVFSGAFLPAGTLPAFTEIFTNIVPSTWFAAAPGADLVAETPFLPVPILWTFMLFVTVVFAGLAYRCFEWDRESSVRHDTSIPREAADK